VLYLTTNGETMSYFCTLGGVFVTTVQFNVWIGSSRCNTIYSDGVV